MRQVMVGPWYSSPLYTCSNRTGFPSCSERSSRSYALRPTDSMASGVSEVDLAEGRLISDLRPSTYHVSPTTIVVVKRCQE